MASKIIADDDTTISGEQKSSVTPRASPTNFGGARARALARIACSTCFCSGTRV